MEWIISNDGDIFLMTDWSRLASWLMDYFPDPKFSVKEVKDFLGKNIPAYKKMKKRTKQGLINDWVNFIAPPVSPPATLKESKSPLTRERERVRTKLRRWRRGGF